ncbi:MAG: SDR family oxidoreductase [Actinobacteria bacterium]|nr:SDR family oxidoreductase [Actinomycetota bacterium]
MLLEGRVAVVTGGAKGMGRAICRLFAEEGAKVTVADVDVPGARETLRLVEEAGGQGLAVECDVTKAAQVKAMTAATVKAFGRLDILVNNAGAVVGAHGRPTNLEVLSEDAWDRVVDLNLKGVFLCSKEAVPHMKAGGYGKIVNMTSLGAISPPSPHPHYHAAKGGVVSLTYDMAAELGPHNIYVNAIMPGPVRTPFFDTIVESKTTEETAAFFAMIGGQAPLGRMGEPEDIAKAALFFASDMSSYVTGTVLPVSGGLPLPRQNP